MKVNDHSSGKPNSVPLNANHRRREAVTDGGGKLFGFATTIRRNEGSMAKTPSFQVLRRGRKALNTHRFRIHGEVGLGRPDLALDATPRFALSSGRVTGRIRKRNVALSTSSIISGPISTT